MKRHYALAVVLCAVLSACASLGLDPPKNLQERIAYVTAGADAVVVSTTNALASHSISSADAQFVSTSGHALSGLVATASSDPDPKSAEARLALAENILRQLQAYVAAHERVQP